MAKTKIITKLVIKHAPFCVYNFVIIFAILKLKLWFTTLNKL